MTYWFASNVDEKRIQKWGGWTSLVQMLDTYRGVIDSLEHLSLKDLDAFSQNYERVEPTAPIVDRATVTSSVVEQRVSNVINLDDYRRRRLA